MLSYIIKKIDILNSIQSETLQMLNGLNEAVKICRQIIFKSFGDENKRVVYFTGSEDFALGTKILCVGRDS